MAYKAGQAFIDVSPSLRGFVTRIKNELRNELKSLDIPLEPEFDKRQVEREGQRAGDTAGGEFAKTFRQRIDKALQALPEVRLGANTSDAEARIAALRGRLDALRDVHVGVDVDAREAEREIADIQHDLRQIANDSADINIQVDAASAHAALSAVEAHARRIDDLDPEIDVHVDSHGAVSSTRFLSGAINGLIVTGALIGPALVPAFGAAAVAAGGLASAVASVGVGFGGLIAAAVPSITAVTEAVKAQELAEKDAATSAGTLAAQRVAAAYAAEQAANRVADAQRAADRAAVDGARQVEQAQQGVARARERAADQIEQAERRVAETSDAVARAQETQVRAQEALTRAREDAVRTLQDMRELVSDLARSELSAELGLEQARLDLEAIMGESGGTAIEAAEINLADARDRLNAINKDGTASELDRARALLDVRQAEERLADAQREAERLSLDRRQAALDVSVAEDRLSDVIRDRKRATDDLREADRAGIDGMDSVVAAQQRLEDATVAVTRAQEQNQIAQAELADVQVEAARSVADAEEALSVARQDAAQANADAARAVSDALAAQAHQAQMAAMQVENSTAAQRNLAFAMGELTPKQRELMEGFLGLRDAFQEWSRSLEPVTVPLFLKAMDLIKQGLPLLTPIVTAVAGALFDLLQQASKALESPFWQEFFAFLAEEAGPNTRKFGEFLGNLAKGFAGLLMAFEPVSEDIVNGLVDMAERFAEWATTLDENQGFQNFLDYVRENWPKVRDMLSSLVDAIKNIVEAAAPLAGPVLDALKGIFDVVAGIDPGLLSAIIAGILGIAAATKVWAIAQAAINLGMKGNLIFIMVGALIGLITWLVRTYQTSEDFRNKVNAVLEAIGAAAIWFYGFLNKWLFRPLVTAFWFVVDTAVSLKDGVVNALTLLGEGARAAWDWFKTNVIDRFVDGLRTLRDTAVMIKDKIVEAFKAMPDEIGAFFGKIWSIMKIPLNEVFGFINTLMIGPLNLILEPFDLDIPELPKLHTGGIVPGGGEKPYMLLGGEGVLNPEATRALGGKAAIDALNDPNAMGGPFDWPDWASWDNVKQGLAIGADIVTGRTAVEGLSQGLLKGIEVILDKVNDGIGAIIPGPPFADVPIETKIEDYSESLLRWARTGNASIQAPKRGGTLGKGTPSFQGNFAFPLPRGSYRVGGGINSYPGHNGQDFPAPTGTPVYSPIGGFFSGVNLGNRSYGRYAEVVAGPLRVIMAHLSALVGSNRMVNAGDLVGRVGSTGNSTGPHLHLTFERNGATQNPRNYLSYDNGGELMPGLTLAYNGTGAKERILDPAESRAYERGYGERVEVHTYGTPRSLTSEVAFMLETRRQARRPLMRG